MYNSPQALYQQQQQQLQQYQQHQPPHLQQGHHYPPTTGMLGGSQSQFAAYQQQQIQLSAAAHQALSLRDAASAYHQPRPHHQGFQHAGLPRSQELYQQSHQHTHVNHHNSFPQRHQQAPSLHNFPNAQPVTAQYQPQVGGAAYNPNHQMKNPNEVFVGDLSFFCEEKDLFDLFSQYGRVESCRIVMNDSQTKSLMFGFVCLSSPQEAATAARVLHNHPFMGRNMKVEVSEKKSLEQLHYNPKKPTYFNGFQVHVSFASTFSPHRVIKPTEFFLRKQFIQYGMINDIVIREYTVHQLQNKQEGYGFITFETEDAAVLAATQCSSIIIDGIVISCKLSYRNKSLAAKQQMLLAASGQLGNGPSPSNAQLGMPPLPPQMAHSGLSSTSTDLASFPGHYDQQNGSFHAAHQHLRSQLPPNPRPMHHNMPRPLGNLPVKSAALSPPGAAYQQHLLQQGMDSSPHLYKHNLGGHNLLTQQQQLADFRLGDGNDQFMMNQLFDRAGNGGFMQSGLGQEFSYLATASSDSSQGSGSMFSSNTANNKVDIDALNLSYAGKTSIGSGSLASGSVDDFSLFLQEHELVKESSSNSWLTTSTMSLGVAMNEELEPPGSPALSAGSHASFTN